MVLDSSVGEAAMTSFIGHGFPKTVQGGVARQTDTRAQLQKDGSEVGPAEEVAVHVRGHHQFLAGSVALRLRGQKTWQSPVSPRQVLAVLALQLERRALAHSWLTHACTGQGIK